jgi:hypothetical protein
MEQTHTQTTTELKISILAKESGVPIYQTNIQPIDYSLSPPKAIKKVDVKGVKVSRSKLLVTLIQFVSSNRERLFFTTSYQNKNANSTLTSLKRWATSMHWSPPAWE